MIAVCMVSMRVGMTVVMMGVIVVAVHVRMRAVLMDMKVLRRCIQDIFMRVRVSIRGSRL